MKRFLFNILGAVAAFGLFHNPLQALPPVVFPPPDLTITPLAANDAPAWFAETVANLAANSQLTTVGGIQVEYVLTGPNSVVNLDNVVLVLHGAPGGYDQGLLIGADLLRRGYTILAVSRPGYLQSQIVPGINNSESQQATQMLDLMVQLGVTKAAVLGYSAGAGVALQVALQSPFYAASLRVNALILESLGGLTQQQAPYRVLREVLQFGALADFGAYLLYLDFHSDLQTYKNTISSILDEDNILPNLELLERMYYVVACKPQFDFIKNLVNTIIPISPRYPGLLNDYVSNLNAWLYYPYNLLTVPTLIVESRYDNNFGYNLAVFAANSINTTSSTTAELITLEKSGDFVWLGEETCQWQSQVEDFLEANP